MNEVWQVYWQKTKENLQVAKQAWKTGVFDLCISRACFATFHAAITALLRLTDYRSGAWKHGKVQAEFVRWLIHRNKVFPNWKASILPELAGLRVDADYWLSAEQGFFESEKPKGLR
ncbi:MAG: hypothetical protein ACK40X_06900 [Armatimonadota bacterium]